MTTPVLPSGGVLPFLRWAGGKRWLVPAIKELTAEMQFTRIVEPFAGSAAITLGLAPERCLLGDINAELISCLQEVRDRPTELAADLVELPNERETYLRIRAWSPSGGYETALRFLYLNRTAWGGLYRVNKQGRFNTPFGNTGRTLDLESILVEASSALQEATIRAADWQTTLGAAVPGDLLFVDPPYVRAQATELFSRYTPSGFSIEQQIEVANATRTKAREGVAVIVATANDPFYDDLYAGWTRVQVSTRVNLGSHSRTRGPTPERIFLSC